MHCFLRIFFSEDRKRLLHKDKNTDSDSDSTPTKNNNANTNNNNSTPVTYTAVPQPSGGTENPVKTGDSTNTIAYVAIMLSALLVVAFAYRRRKED